jgi:hypothetical protein
MTDKLIFNNYEYQLAKILPASSGTGSNIQTTITGLDNTKQYEFIVLSFNNYGSTVSVPLTVYTAPPQNPNLFKASTETLNWTAIPISSNGLRIIWNDYFIEELNYNLYISSDNQNFDFITSVSEYLGSYDIEDLVLGNSYYILINAFIGTGPDEGQLYLTSSTGPVQTLEIPKPPINFQYTYFDNDEVTLSWDYQDEIYKRTEIFYSINGLDYSLIYDASAEPTPKVTISGLTSDTTWWFKIRTGNPFGNSDFAGPVIIGTLPGVPETPTGLTGFAGISSYIQINWISGATNEDGYNIFRSTDNVNYTNIQILSRDNLSFVDIEKAENTLYYYKVNAFNEGGTSGFSNIVGITSSILPVSSPTGPTGISGSVLYNTINISWIDQATNEFGYKIYVKQG